MTTAVFAAACTDYGNPAEIGYEITVLYPNGKPVQSNDTGSARSKVNVVLTDADGKTLNSETMGVLDANGTAHIDYKVPGEYTININNVPAGYRYVPEKTFADRARQTVYLLNIETSYEINVLAPDGSPANGYTVKVMDGENELASGNTNAQGLFVTPEINAGTYSVLVSEATGKIHHKSVKTSPTGAAVTVKTFEPAVWALDDEHKMTDEQFDVWDTEMNGGLDSFYISALRDNYLFEAETFGAEETFYILHADKTGTYTVTLKPDVLVGTTTPSGNYIVKFYHVNSYDTYDTTRTLNGTENGGKKSTSLPMTEGEDWIFSVTSVDHRDRYTVPIAIAFNREPLTQAASGAGNYTLTFNDNNEAVLQFTPSVSGMYTISLVGEHANNPKYIAYSRATQKPLNPIDKDLTLYEQADAFPIEANYPDDYFAKDENGKPDGSGSETLLYHIFLDKVTTTSVQIKIERTGDAEPLLPEVDERDVPVPTGLSKQTFAEDYESYTYEWHWLEADGTQTPVEKDGKWVVEINEVEYEVYMAITKNFDEQIYSFATTEYVGADSSTPSEGEGEGSDNTESGGIQDERQNNRLVVRDLNDNTIAYNYRNFVAEYAKFASKAEKPAQGQDESDNAYKARLDKFDAYASATDGVYALNADLKTFAERYMNNQWVNIINPTLFSKPAQPWLLACGYFTKTAK